MTGKHSLVRRVFSSLNKHLGEILNVWGASRIRCFESGESRLQSCREDAVVVELVELEVLVAELLDQVLPSLRI